MSYLDYHDGDIILVKVNHFTTWYRKLFAKLIQFFDGVYYHHAQIYFKGFLYEANNKVVSQILSYNKGSEIMVLRLNEPLIDEEQLVMQHYLEESLGKNYDYWGAMLHQLIHILLFRRVWIGKKANLADSKPYCTEFVTRAMNKLRGYFPEYYKTSPSKLKTDAALYYKVVFEGKV
jgi:hypothetical protein